MVRMSTNDTVCAASSMFACTATSLPLNETLSNATTSLPASSEASKVNVTLTRPFAADAVKSPEAVSCLPLPSFKTLPVCLSTSLPSR